LQQTVDSDRTLLVDGPASVRVVSGKVEVFDYRLKEAARIVVREGKRLPFLVLEKAVFDLSIGPNSSKQEVVGKTIPESWNKPLQTVFRVQKKPVTVLLLGKIDSGKTSYCTYLVNKLIDEKCRVAVLDGDLGQSDIGPSSTVGYGITSKRVTDLYDLKLENAFFVGVTSPIMEIGRIIEGLAAMKAEILQKSVDFVVVNTDGWVTGDIAIQYKTALVKALAPDVVVGVQVENELKPLIASIDGTPVILVEASFYLSQRREEKRKRLREMTYARYLKDAKNQCYPLSQVIIEPSGALPMHQEPEKGLLVGLYSSGRKFLGVGVLREINHIRRALKVQTAVPAKPQKIFIGRVILNEKFQEIQD
jgi:polynucleotide 5'-hydroxyl-kinase GRC3/NOL9